MASFTPFTKTAVNVTDLLAEAAKDRLLDPKEVDFDLLGIQTLVKTPKHKEWTIIEEPLEKLFEEKLIKSQLLEIRQEYEIRIRPFEQSKFLKDIQLSILTNKTKSKVVAVFKEGTVFPNVKNLAKLLRNEIYRRKLRLGLLVQHFEKTLNSTLIKLSKAVKPGVVLKKDVRITIGESPGPLLPVDDEIILHYKKKQHEERNLIDTIDAGDLMFEYIKPQIGKNGRGCDGKFFEVRKPKIMYDRYKPDLSTIEIVEDDESVKYYAKREGYYKDEFGLISVSQKVAIESATFKNTGSINAGEDKDISVNIAKSNSNDDSVGSGVKIDVKELNVEGTIGASAKVKAQALSVGEQTHMKAELEAVEHAKIKLHRGKLKAKTAEIDILENGTVEADEIHVKKMLGGEVIGRHIVIEDLVSNTMVIASELIEVEKISGEHNQLIINPKKIEAYHDKIESLKTEYKEKKLSVEKSLEGIAKEIAEHEEQLDRIKTFQKRVLAATKAGKTPNKSDVLRIRLYKDNAKKLEAQSQKIALEEKELAQAQEELDKMYEADSHAKIINKSGYDGTSKVIFIDVQTNEHYSMTPNGEYPVLVLQKEGSEKKIGLG